MVWNANGGHSAGRKVRYRMCIFLIFVFQLPIVFAAWLLKDNAMKNLYEKYSPLPSSQPLIF